MYFKKGKEDEEHFQKVIAEGKNFHMVIPEVTNLSISDTKKNNENPVFH